MRSYCIGGEGVLNFEGQKPVKKKGRYLPSGEGFTKKHLPLGEGPPLGGTPPLFNSWASPKLEHKGGFGEGRQKWGEFFNKILWIPAFSWGYSPLSGLRTRGFELIKVFIKKRELRYLTLKMSRVKKRNYKIPSHS